MILTGDYHTHTTYSHGKNSVIQNVMAAKEKGLKEIAITDHGFAHLMFGIKPYRLGALRKDVEDAKMQTGLNVLMGIESNLISVDGKTDLKKKDLEKFDIYLCGIHQMLIYNSLPDLKKIFLDNFFTRTFKIEPSRSLIENTTKAYINAIKNNPIDILTHINFKCFCDVKEVAKCCSDYGTYLEINTKKYHITAEQLDEIAQTGVRFVIDSDAHSYDRVGDTAIAEELLSKAHVSLDRIDNIEGRTPNFRFAEYKKHNL